MQLFAWFFDFIRFELAKTNLRHDFTSVSACEYDNSRVTFSNDSLSEDADGDSLKEIMTEILTYFGFLAS